MKKWFLIVCLFLVSFAAVVPVKAATQMPNYAQGGNLNTQVQSKGKAITEMISLIVVGLCIIGILIGAGYIGVGKADTGKVYVIGGIVGIILAGTVYGIAALVA